MTLSSVLLLAKQNLIRSKNGLFGQVLTFSAMLLPILTKRLEQLQFLIIVSAVGSIFALIGTWSFPSVFPSLRQAREASVSLWATIITICATFTVCVFICLLSNRLEVHTRAVLFWSAWFMLAQSGYLVVLAIAVREQRFDSVNDLRLNYGITSFCLTLAACTRGKYYASLVLAATLSFATAALIAVFKGTSPVKSMAQDFSAIRFQSVCKYLLDYCSAAIAALISGVAFQLAAVLLTGFGMAANAWAIVLRISGGFTTVSGQLIAPMYEIHLTRELRQNNFREASQVQRSALIAGVALSVFAIAAVELSLWYSNVLIPLQPHTQSTVIICGVVYPLAILSSANIMKNIVLSGGQRQYLIWIILKVSSSLAILPQLRGNTLLIGIACIEVVFQGSYIAMTFLRLKTLYRAQSSQIATDLEAVTN